MNEHHRQRYLAGMINGDDGMLDVLEDVRSDYRKLAFLLDTSSKTCSSVYINEYLRQRHLAPVKKEWRRIIKSLSKLSLIMFIDNDKGTELMTIPMSYFNEEKIVLGDNFGASWLE